MKVGKAIYNILSQSTDVQSNFPFNTTDYAPTGTELVTNGDFSTTGTELLLNNDFTGGSTSWTVIENAGGSVTFADNQCEIISDGANGQGIRQFVLTSGKSYKVVVDVASITGTFKIMLGAELTEVSATGIQTFYGVATATDILIYRVVGETLDVVLNSVSVQELGEGWAFTSGASITALGAKITHTPTAGVISQSPYLVLGKNYKFTYEITENISGGLKINSAVIPEMVTTVGVHTRYFEADSTSVSIARTSTVDNDVTITNITVQEMILTKIFPELAPPDIDAPYIVYSVVSNSPSDTKNANGDIDTANIEVYGFQTTYNLAVDLGVSVRAALDRKTGTYNTIEIQSTNYVNEQMDVNEARKLWAAIQDYSIRIKNI